MNFRKALLLPFFASLLASSFSNAQTEPKIATINLPEVRVAFYRTQEVITESQAKKKALEESRIALKLKESKEKFDSLVKAYQDAKRLQSSTPEAIEKMQFEAQLAQGDLREIYIRWKEWHDKSMLDLNKEIALQARHHYNRIQEATQKVGEAMGFDLVIDSVGETSTLLPAVLYLRNGTDISKEVIAELNKNAPPKEAAPAEVAEPKN